MTRRRVEVLLLVALMMLAGATTTLLILTSDYGPEMAPKDSKAEIASMDSKVVDIVEIVESNPDGILT